MSIWVYESEEFATIVNSIVAFDEQLTFALTLIPTENMTGAFLYTDSSYSGYMTAQLSGWSSPKTIGTRSPEPTCFLGDLSSGVEYSIELIVSLPESSGLDGEQIIPIRVGIGAIGDAGTNILFEDLNDFWYANPAEADAGWWR